MADFARRRLVSKNSELKEKINQLESENDELKSIRSEKVSRRICLIMLVFFFFLIINVFLLFLIQNDQENLALPIPGKLFCKILHVLEYLTFY